jgi:dynein light intermediate chain 2, cytosolic
MSKSRSSESKTEDIWSKLQRNPPIVAAAGTTENGEETPSSVGANNGSSILFVGDLGSGKSTLIQTFLKPTAPKDTKPTIALEYNFARRTANGVKSVANLWEIGGDLVEPKLMEIGITTKTLQSAAVVVCCDLSKPHNILNSVLRSISAIKETTNKRVAELQAVNVNQVTEIRERLSAPYKGHPDENRVRPLDVPVCIIANKHDLFRALPLADRRAVMQVLRFVAHFFGAYLITAANSEASQRDTCRTLISNLAFNMPIKPACDSSAEKPIFITRGADSFQNILLTAAGGEGKVGVCLLVCLLAGKFVCLLLCLDISLFCAFL